MNDDRSLERAARSWLEAGPTQAPDRPVEAALVQIQITPQERDLRIPWRFPPMFNNRVAVAALATVIVIVGAGFALTRMSRPGPGGPGPTPSPSPTTLPSPSPIASASSVPELTISTGDVGKVLQAGTYRVDGFAAPFTVTLPAGWIATEFTPNSIGLARKADASVNVYMAVMGKVYSDPCHATAGPKAVGTGVDALVAALSSMTGFVVTNVGAATVGGAEGVGFTITNSIDVATAKCSGNMLPIGTYENNGGDVDIPMFGGERDQFWVLDAGGVRVFMAVTDSQVGATKAVRDGMSFGN